MTYAHAWRYQNEVRPTEVDLSGFDVEATDGSIGEIDEHSFEPDWIVVDTGFWIFGKKRLIPAGVVERIDYDAEKVYINMTKEQVKEAPDFDETADRADADWPIVQYGPYFDPFIF